MLSTDFKEIFTGELVSVTGGVLAGTALAFTTDQLQLLPGLLMILPGFLEMRGSISGSLSSRLSSGLFLGVLKPKMEHNRIVRGNVFAALILTMLVCVLLGILAYGVNYLLFGIIEAKIIFIVILAGLIASAIEIPAAIFFTFWLFKRGHDPNNVMGPFITTSEDIVSVFALLLAIVII